MVWLYHPAQQVNLRGERSIKRAGWSEGGVIIQTVAQVHSVKLPQTEAKQYESDDGFGNQAEIIQRGYYAH